MNKMKGIIAALILLSAGIVGYAQQDKTTKPEKGGEGVGRQNTKSTNIKQTNKTDQHATDNQRVPGEQTDKGKVDEHDNRRGNGTEEISGKVNNNLLDANTDGVAGKSTNTDPQASNTSAVNQTTTSMSGSPATPMFEDTGKDGTNNAQKATINMAGSPIPGKMNLDKVASNENHEFVESIKLRQGEAQSDSSQLNSKAHKQNQAKAQAKGTAKKNASSSKDKTKTDNKKKKNKG
jgi:hypothetical protein